MARRHAAAGVVERMLGWSWRPFGEPGAPGRLRHDARGRRERKPSGEELRPPLTRPRPRSLRRPRSREEQARLQRMFEIGHPGW